MEPVKLTINWQLLLGAHELTQFCMSRRNFNEYDENIRQQQTKFGRPDTQDLCSPDREVVL